MTIFNAFKVQAAELRHMCSGVFHWLDCPYRLSCHRHSQPALACSKGCHLCPSMVGLSLSLCLCPLGAESSLPSSPAYPCPGRQGEEHVGSSRGVWKTSLQDCTRAEGCTALLCSHQSCPPEQPCHPKQLRLILLAAAHAS